MLPLSPRSRFAIFFTLGVLLAALLLPSTAQAFQALDADTTDTTTTISGDKIIVRWDTTQFRQLTEALKQEKAFLELPLVSNVVTVIGTIITLFLGALINQYFVSRRKTLEQIEKDGKALQDAINEALSHTKALREERGVQSFNAAKKQLSSSLNRVSKYLKEGSKHSNLRKFLEKIDKAEFKGVQDRKTDWSTDIDQLHTFLKDLET